MLKLLLEHGADPNRANTKRYSVLSVASREERNTIEMLKILLDHGADMYNGGDCYGSFYNNINPFPFEGMFEKNYMEGVKLFLERGYDSRKYLCTLEGRPSALHVAIDRRGRNFSGSGPDMRMLSLLINYYRAKGILSSELERGLRESWSPLFHALDHSSKLAHATLLMRSGADPNLEDCQGNTALGHVLFNDTSLRAKSIKLFIQHGAHLRNYIERLFWGAN
ncbi:hypothetical protein QAD02_000183 [Eretmocerus hayati]|uniref:Uncharacterized protein n=1 Tax=Eretmocerus hayati TaxID=131215 RepID=A0ACC2NCW8_9HYME|nr:hypothetical protein QAD02_000183 [Eretmocerus hayati]